MRAFVLLDFKFAAGPKRRKYFIGVSRLHPALGGKGLHRRLSVPLIVGEVRDSQEHEQIVALIDAKFPYASHGFDAHAIPLLRAQCGAWPSVVARFDALICRNPS